MITSEFNLPPQCVNCSSLHARAEEYYEKIDELNNGALEAGIKTEQEVLDADEIMPGQQEVEAGYTRQLLDAAAFAGSKLHTEVQLEANLASMICIGTVDPAAPRQLPCRFLQSLLR